MKEGTCITSFSCHLSIIPNGRILLDEGFVLAHGFSELNPSFWAWCGTGAQSTIAGACGLFIIVATQETEVRTGNRVKL